MVIDLAEHTEDGFISLKDIAARQGLSKISGADRPALK